MGFRLVYLATPDRILAEGVTVVMKVLSCLGSCHAYYCISYA